MLIVGNRAFHWKRERTGHKWFTNKNVDALSDKLHPRFGIKFVGGKGVAYLSVFTVSLFQQVQKVMSVGCDW